MALTGTSSINYNANTVTSTESTDVSVIGLPTVTVYVRGTFTGSIDFYASMDGITFDIPISATNMGIGDGSLFTSATVEGIFRMTVSGFQAFRAAGSILSGSANVQVLAAIGDTSLDTILGYVFTKSSMRDGGGTDLTSTTAGAKQGLDINIASSNITLPVSVASLPLPLGAATSANQVTEIASLASIDAGIPAALGQVTMAASMPVVIASNQTAIPVTGAFFQATQPISGTVLVSNFPTTLDTNYGTVGASTLRGAAQIGNAIGAADFNAGATGAQTLRVTANAGTNLNTSLLALEAGGNLAGIKTAVEIIDNAIAGSEMQVDVVAALPTGNNNIGDVDVIPPTLTKGTQGSTGFTVQQLTNAGRNARHFMLDAYTAAPLVEAVQSVVQWYNNAAVAGTTQPAVVPAGKTLRLQSWTISTKSLAVVGSAVVRIRINTAGLGVLSSPLAFSFEAGSRSGAATTAMTGGLDTLTGQFPEGFEIPQGSGLAFSMAGYGPTGTLLLEGVTRFQVHGYEY